MKKKILNVCVAMFFCLLSVFLLISVLNKAAGKIPFIAGRACVWVLTPSMEETIPEKSYILIKKVEDASDEIEVGDIITFYSDDELIAGRLNTHRVVGINTERGTFVTKGDNNAVADAYEVPYENVVGKYMRSLPVLTVLGRFFATGTGFFVLIFSSLLILSAVYLPDIVRGFKSKEKSDKEKEQLIQKMVEEEVEKLKKLNSQDKNNK